MTTRPAGGDGDPESLFLSHHDGDAPELAFRNVVNVAARMLWVLGAAEECLAALYDVMDGAVGEQGLWAALSERLEQTAEPAA